jgi:hypothetical protein
MEQQLESMNPILLTLGINHQAFGDGPSANEGGTSSVPLSDSVEGNISASNWVDISHSVDGAGAVIVAGTDASLVEGPAGASPSVEGTGNSLVDGVRVSSPVAGEGVSTVDGALEGEGASASGRVCVSSLVGVLATSFVEVNVEPFASSDGRRVSSLNCVGSDPVEEGGLSHAGIDAPPTEFNG